MFPTMKELNELYPGDIRCLVEYMEEHSHIKTFIQNPSGTKNKIRDAGIAGLRKNKRRKFLREILKDESESLTERLFGEVIEYINLKLQKYRKD